MVETPDSAIHLPEDKDIVCFATKERVVGREVFEWSPHCGTYGQGGPGFFGLKLKATGTYPEEWLILCLWGAGGWLEVNGRWLQALPRFYNIQRPLHSNFSGQTWDKFGHLVISKTVTRFDVDQRTTQLDIGDVEIRLHGDSNKQPPHGNGEPRVLPSGDDLRQGWIIAKYPWVEI